MLLFRLFCALFLLVACTSSSSNSASRAEAMLFFGGSIVTMDPEQASVDAVLVVDGEVAALGALEELGSMPAAEHATRFDLEGAVMYPGFVDGHAHLVGIGTNQMQVDLMGTTSYAAVVQQVEEFSQARAFQSDEWLIGRGWDQNDWELTDFPTHHLLSEAFPDRAVVLSRVDGHAILANAFAMRLAGVTRDTAAPEGGAILRDDNGEPTGVFVDNAEGLILSHLPSGSVEELEQAVKMAAQAMQAKGLTAIHDAGISKQTVEICQALAKRGELGIRVYGMVPASDERELDQWFEDGPLIDPNDQVTVRSIKVYADGALGSRGAALLEDYSDDAGNRGLLVTPAARIQQIAERALQTGFQVNTHAIGDRANRLVLDAYQQALESAPGGSQVASDHRFRVEHAQVISPTDIPRFRALGVIPSMQTQHQSSDMPWAEQRLGSQRVRGAYAWRSLLDSGVVVCGGSDAPVERLDPIASYRAAVARVDENAMPRGGWYAEQCMSRREGLLQLTSWPAYAAFQEQKSGRIAVGMHADFTVLSADLRQVPVDEFGEVEVLATIFAGRVVYQAGQR